MKAWRCILSRGDAAEPETQAAYDAMGRQTSATDAAGTTTFTYDAIGQLLSEQVSGLYAKTLTRHYDTFGRNVGYSVNNERKATFAYDLATGRLATMGNFAWEYLPGSHLKSRLTYPNGATAAWEYEPKRDLLARVTNTINGAVASQYDYVNDLIGRRTEIGKSGSMMADANETQHYGYNVRDELIFGQNQTYAYDDIGNRTAAEGKTYVANNLNQYTAIDDFVPEYDADGNQTLIKTETGVCSVVYNAENRPVRWESGDAVITMTFDRLGRRVDYCETRAGQAVTHFRFVYDNFLCVQRLDAANGNAVRSEFVWDPTESIATRPLVFQPASGETAYYFHDGNKNVSEVFYHTLQDGIAAHYDYAPFGAITRTARATHVTNRDLLSENPFRFSSEYHDATLGLVYYNYRHYNFRYGRWLGRDVIDDPFLKSEYSFLINPLNCFDLWGLLTIHNKTYSVETVEDILNGAVGGDAGNSAAYVQPIGVIMLIPQRIERGETFPSKKCSSGCMYNEKIDLKIGGAQILAITYVQPKLAPNSSLDRQRVEKLFAALREHEQRHIASYQEFNEDWRRFLSPDKEFSVICGFCTGLSDEEAMTIRESCIKAAEGKVLEHAAKKMRISDHAQIGDGFDASKVRDFLEGKRDDFR